VRIPTGICYDQNCRPSAGFSATDIQSATQPWGEQSLSSMDWSWKNHGKPWKTMDKPMILRGKSMVSGEDVPFSQSIDIHFQHPLVMSK
jgi:hypothetical protein